MTELEPPPPSGETPVFRFFLGVLFVTRVAYCAKPSCHLVELLGVVLFGAWLDRTMCATGCRNRWYIAGTLWASAALCACLFYAQSIVSAVLCTMLWVKLPLFVMSFFIAEQQPLEEQKKKKTK